MRRGTNPDIIIRTPDGSHMAVAMTSTDYVLPAETPEPEGPSHLLAIEGLWQAVEFIERWQQQAQLFPPPERLPDTDYDGS